MFVQCSPKNDCVLHSELPVNWNTSTKADNKRITSLKLPTLDFVLVPSISRCHMVYPDASGSDNPIHHQRRHERRHQAYLQVRIKICQMQTAKYLACSSPILQM